MSRIKVKLAIESQQKHSKCPAYPQFQWIKLGKMVNKVKSRLSTGGYESDE